nr:MAG: DnaG-like DNA primase [uncultured archaeon]
MNIISQYNEPKYRKQLKTRFVSEIPFGLNSLKKQKDLLIITEGMTDALSVIQAGFQCLSPITTRIKKKDIEKMINYVQYYDKVLVINDNEKFSKNNSGLEGSIDTLKVLIKHNINCFIGIIPNPKKLEKIDLNDYLRPKKESFKKLGIIIESSIKGLDFLTDTINEQSSQDDIVEILEILPENDIVVQGNTIKKLAKKIKLTLSDIKKIYKQYQDDKLLKERKKQGVLQEQKKDEKEDTKDIFERITLDNYDIEIREEGIFKVIWRHDQNGELHSNETPILDGKLEVLFKVYDTKLDIERFAFVLNGIRYNTYTIMNMIGKFEANIYEGTHGRDIIKKVFNHFSDKIVNRNPEYIIGFDNGWKLPHLEKEGNYTIISYTDIDKIIYKNAQKCIKIHTNKENQEIIKKLKLFITTTQTTHVKLLKFITWTIASVFRMPIIDFFKVFPIFYNYGERNAGKGSLEEFWIINFYGIHKKLLPSKTLESPSRLEDYLASSTFPIAITEADGRNIRNTLSIIKEHASDNTDFERKRPDQTLAFSKPKTAGVCLDSNIIIKAFNDPALNSKCIMNEFKKKDIPLIDFEWKKLFRKLKRVKLFSFIYNATKDWNDKTLFKIFDKIIEETKEKLKNYEEIERTNPRILLTFQICLFGLYIWNLSFGFPLEQILNISFNQLLESLISGRKIIPRNLVEQFYRFCLRAFNYDTGYDDSFGNWHKGDNPKFLTCRLEQHKNKRCYAFTQDNLRDFNEYVRDFGKDSYNLTELANKLEDGLNNKKDIIHSNCYPFTNKKEKVILIKKEWLNIN